MAEIAVSVTIEILKKASTLVADLIAKEGSHLFQLREEISWIETEMRRIQSYLKDAEHKRGQSEGVANFIRDVRNLAFDVEDTMEKNLPLPPKGKGFKGFLKRAPHIFSNSYRARNFLAEIDVIKRRVQDLNRSRQTYDIKEQHTDEGRDERRSFPHIEEPNITGLENLTKELVAKISGEDPGLRVISITGMPGLGKTTLAKEVYNLVRTNFDCSAWVYVSQQPFIKNILQDIARQVGLKIDEWEDGGEANVYRHLSQNRYVIVIDDIWQTSTWDDIKIAIPTNSKSGSRIILTSRNRDVGVHVGGWDSLCELQPLGESESKRIFEAHLGPVQTLNDPPGLEEIGKEILHRCGGVPLAIVVVSGLLKLRERSLSAWKGLLEQLDQGQVELSKKLALSYVDLPAHLKPCFLYFGLFPEDHEIDTFDLINMWAAEGFIKGSRVREAEDAGDDYLNLLIARNLIQVVRKDHIGKVKSCRIHDILRSLCIREAEDINFFTISTDLTPYNCKSVRRLTTHGMRLNDSISSNCQTPKLRSFLCFGENINLPRDFLKDANLARVLLLSINKSIPISKEIWSLKNLTYLKLQGSEAGHKIEIPESIIILESLVTLDFQDVKSPLTRVPAWWIKLDFPMVIWNMNRLRHLLLPNTPYRVIPKHKGFDPNAISFQNFQTLAVAGKIFEADWLHKISEVKTLNINCCVDRLAKDSCLKIANLLLNSTLVLNKLETLNLQLRMFEEITVTKLNLSGYQNLSNLYLKNVVIGQCFQQDELPLNLTKVVLVNCDLNGDPLEVMKKLPKLRVLNLINGSYGLGQLVCTGEPGNFPQLEQLVILLSRFKQIIIEDGGMPRLKELLIPGHDSDGGMPRLKELLIPGHDSDSVKLATRLAEIRQQTKFSVEKESFRDLFNYCSFSERIQLLMAS